MFLDDADEPRNHGWEGYVIVKNILHKIYCECTIDYSKYMYMGTKDYVYKDYFQKL